MRPTEHKITVDDIHSDITHLSHLIDEITSKVIGMSRGADKGHNLELDRVGSLLWIARDMVELTERQLAETLGHFNSMKSGASKC
ncbi:hypothetical protein [Rhizobium tubonense]|uniref:NTP pyrophosphohydrolase MazG putative catalytic core domain-containing protein n=1 Tax=Rhizobium tubonense TaxID=484088 RepID=A0A2W4C907_9HYPH|nr:hypothetical protein [Rhizobium tubonense]PZM07605.1 hypothetical protein CPY51_31240 [Rhizobium tubonense]